MNSLTFVHLLFFCNLPFRPKQFLDGSLECWISEVSCSQNVRLHIIWPAYFHYFTEFPRAVMKLLRNPVYMLLNLASVFEMVIVTGFITFVPKYLETQFGLRTSQANLYTGKGDQWCIFTLWTSSRLRLLLSIVGNFLHFAARICPTCSYPFPPVHRLLICHDEI